MDMQDSFFLFVVIFGMVTSSFSEDNPCSGRSVREHGGYTVPTPQNQKTSNKYPKKPKNNNKNQQKEAKTREK